MRTKKSVFGLVCGFLILITLFLVYGRVLEDFNQDLGRHIKMGEIIWKTKTVPNTNLFSYTNQNFPTIDHHWGSQVVFFWLNRIGGGTLLGFFNFALGVSAIGILAVFVFGWNLLPGLLSLSLLLPLLSDRIGVRPEIFGNAFFALLCLFAYRKGLLRRYKRYLPLLILVWANLHIGYLVGMATVAILLMAQVITEKKQRRALLRENLLTGLLMLVMIGITPWGWKGALREIFIFRDYGYQVVENQSWLYLYKFYNFSSVHHIAWAFSAVVAGMIFARRKPFLAEGLILLFAGAMTMAIIRAESFFFFIGFLSLSLSLEKMIRDFGKARKWFFALLAMVLAVVFVCNQAKSSLYEIGFGEKEVYKNGVDYLLRSGIKGKVVNNFDIGGYLDYRLYPDYQVFVDNRPEAYPAKYFDEVYKYVLMNRKPFDEFVAREKVGAVIWAHRDLTDWSKIFLRLMMTNKEWKMTYLDGWVVVFEKNLMVERIDSDLVLDGCIVKRDWECLLGLANFFGITGDLAGMRTAANGAYAINPNYLPVKNLYSRINLL